MKHLRYFDALAREGHFGRAADECAISQPALSVQIRELEQIVGAPLVERGARQIHLTGLGVEFAERIEAILRSVEALEDLARASHLDPIGKFRLGVIPTIAPYLLSEVVKALAARYPGLDLRPREAKTQTLIKDLMEARLDAAIVALPVSEPSLCEVSLFAEKFVLLRPSADADKPVPPTDQLLQERLLLLEEGHCFRDQALAFCSGFAALPRNIMEGSSLSTLVQMVGAGIGITLIPEMAVSVETRSADVSLALLQEPCPSRTVGMIWRKTNPLADHLMDVANLIGAVGTKRNLEATAR